MRTCSSGWYPSSRWRLLPSKSLCLSTARRRLLPPARGPKKIIDKTEWMHYTLLNQTVEAEITAKVPSQRARVAESRVRSRSSNGPLRAQSNAWGSRAEYSATCWHTSVAGGMMVPCEGHGLTAVNQGGTADKKFYSSLTEAIFLSGAFVFLRLWQSCQRRFRLKEVIP